MGYFFKRTKDFRELIFTRPFSQIYQLDPSILLKAAGWILLAWTGWKLLKRNEPIPVIQRMGFFSFLLLMFYYGGLSMDMNHPHYFMPIWWVMIFFGAASIVRSKGKLRGLLTAAGALTIVMNIVFVFAAHAWIARSHGTRGTHYTPIHSELENAVREICSDVSRRHLNAPVPVLLETQDVIGVFSYPVEYYFRHEPECVGHVISAQLVPPSLPGLEHFRLGYKDPADELSAALNWRRID